MKFNVPQSRPAWLQRSPGAFGIASRGSGRGGMVDRGRMRGKSAYHSIYQRPSTIYDDSISAISMKVKRNNLPAAVTTDFLTVYCM